MKNTHIEVRGGEFRGDLPAWIQANAPDNQEQLDRLRRNLRLARQKELTPRQKEILDLYYDHGMTVPQIARSLELNRSTVSRTLKRAMRRLYRCLQYAL